MHAVYTLYRTVQYTLYTLYRTVQCTLYTLYRAVQCTLYTLCSVESVEWPLCVIPNEEKDIEQCYLVLLDYCSL